MDVLLQATVSLDASHLAQATPDDTQTQSPNLQSQITRVINSISDRELRVTVERILGDLVFILDWLSLIGEDCSPVDELEKSLWMLEAAAVDSHSLVSFIEDNAMQLEGLDDIVPKFSMGPGPAQNDHAQSIVKRIDRVFPTLASWQQVLLNRLQ